MIKNKYREELWRAVHYVSMDIFFQKLITERRCGGRSNTYLWHQSPPHCPATADHKKKEKISSQFSYNVNNKKLINNIKSLRGLGFGFRPVPRPCALSRFLLSLSLAERCGVKGLGIRVAGYEFRVWSLRVLDCPTNVSPQRDAA